MSSARKPAMAPAPGRKPYAAIDFEDESALGKQDREVRIVDAVFRRLGLENYRLSGHDRPDVLAEFGDTPAPLVLGCEVMLLHGDTGAKGSELRRFRERWRKIMRRVVSALNRDRAPAPYCRVDFRCESLDGFDDASLVAEFIHVGHELRQRSVFSFPNPATPGLNRLLIEVRVIEPEGDDLLWWPSHLQSGPVVPLGPAAAKAIRTKTRQARTYDWKGASERWLLLHAQAHGLTDLFGQAERIPLHRIPRRSPFSQVLIWDRFSEDIWSVFPQFKVICDGGGRTREYEALPRAIQPFARHDRHYPTRPKYG